MFVRINTMMMITLTKNKKINQIIMNASLRSYTQMYVYNSCRAHMHSNC